MTLLSGILKPPEWTRQALCAQVDPEIFFPEVGDGTRYAKRICNSCDVKKECLEYSLQNNERFGIWGGTAEKERRKLNRKLKRNRS